MPEKTITIGVKESTHELLKRYALRRGFSLRVAITKAVEKIAARDK